MNKPISVIIPCYNVENLIDRCLDSIANQTIGIDNLEVILVDDASTDGTWSKIEAFEKKHSESVLAVRCDSNGRQGTARNIGIQYASAEYVTFIDSDDWVEPDYLEKLYALMAEQSYDFTMCMHVRDDGTQQISIPKDIHCQRFLIDNEDKRKTLLLCMSAGSSSCGKMYRKGFLLKNGIFFAEGVSYEDHYFILLLYLYVTRFCIIDYIGYHYFVNLNSTVLSRNSSRHKDVLLVDEITWNECSQRGFLDAFREELEYYFMQVGFLGPLRTLLLRYEEPPYEFYLKLRENLIKRSPSFLNNKYLEEYMTNMNKELLKIAAVSISENEFAVLFYSLKRD